MYQQFDDGVSSVMATLGSQSHKRANRHYFNLLRKYLVSNNIPYSHQAAYDWLSENKQTWPHRKYVCCRTAAFKLNDVLTNGTVTSVRHYPYDNAPKYVKLSEWSKYLLDSSLNETKYTGNGKNLFRIAVAEFLLFLEGEGITNSEDISIRHFVAYLHFMAETHENIAGRKAYIRCVAVFLSGASCSRAFQMLAEKKRTPSVLLLDNMSGTQRALFIEAGEAGKVNARSVDDFYKSIQNEHYLLEAHHYSLATQRGYLECWKSLYLFLVLNSLDYSPQVAQCWANYCKKELISHPRLSDCDIPYPCAGKIDCGRHYADKDKLAALPVWSRKLLNQYLIDEQRRGQARRTLETQKYACIRFLQFMQQLGITSCAEMTTTMINDFNLADIHATFEGKKGYNSRIGRFLAYLGEQGFVPQTLRLALPCKFAQKSKIVKILSSVEVDLLYESKNKAKSPLELRDAAIVMLGLRMGLRAGDIVKLKYGDISWQDRTISTLQNKTGKLMLLPMPVEVGNCIYNYLKCGQQRYEHDYVFIPHKAPYFKITSSVCAASLNRMLRSHKNDCPKYGFHITRKTFASRMLMSGNSVDTISNLLGHCGNSTVMTYLSTDDEKMRMCAISAIKVM